jgi:hypothetical protein
MHERESPELTAMPSHSRTCQILASLAALGLFLACLSLNAALAQVSPPAPAPAQSSTGDPPAIVARVAQLTGVVSFRAAGDDNWDVARLNYPVTPGSALWTEPGARATIDVAGSHLTMNSTTEFDINNLDAQSLQATLPQGEVYLRLRNLSNAETFSITTPRGVVTIQSDGRYGIAAGDTQHPTLVTVLDGSAQITGDGEPVNVSANATATITGADTFQITVGRAQIDPFLAAMLAQEHPVASASTPPAVQQMTGNADLAAYGTWRTDPQYGQVWYPRVAAGWVPYRDGYWSWVEPWGWTWIDYEPWGFAPFHYGRWCSIGGIWAWAPAPFVVNSVVAAPVYTPALVAFFGFGGGGVSVGVGGGFGWNSVGWVPLAPDEPFLPWYHASETYIRNVNVTSVRNITNITNNNINNITINRFTNLRAASVVPASVMQASRPVATAVQPIPPNELERARPMLGRPPVTPAATTIGVTHAVAQRLHLPENQVALAQHHAPGPPIRPTEAGHPMFSAAALDRPPSPLAQGGHPGVVDRPQGGPGGLTPHPNGLPSLREPGSTAVHAGVDAHGMAGPRLSGPFVPHHPPAPDHASYAGSPTPTQFGDRGTPRMVAAAPPHPTLPPARHPSALATPHFTAPPPHFAAPRPPFGASPTSRVAGPQPRFQTAPM